MVFPLNAWKKWHGQVSGPVKGMQRAPPGVRTMRGESSIAISPLWYRCLHRRCWRGGTKPVRYLEIVGKDVVESGLQDVLVVQALAGEKSSPGTPSGRQNIMIGGLGLSGACGVFAVGT